MQQRSASQGRKQNDPNRWASPPVRSWLARRRRGTENCSEDLLDVLDRVGDEGALDRERARGVARRADQGDLVRVAGGQVRRELDVGRVGAVVQVQVGGDGLA